MKTVEASMWIVLLAASSSLVAQVVKLAWLIYGR